MLPISFFAQNLNFSLYLFLSLVTFATFWLYFDAWLARKKFNEFVKWFGFLLLSISFLVQGSIVDLVGSKVISADFVELAYLIIRAAAYFAIIYSLFRDPIQKVPETKGLELGNNSAVLVTGSFISLRLLVPLQGLFVALLYYRKSTKGLERHLRTLAIAFFFLSLAESLSLLDFLRTSKNLFLYNLAGSFGPLWVLEEIFLAIAGFLIGKWVWSYLVKRLSSQLFIVFTSLVVLVFILVTASFTFLLLRNIQSESINNLSVASRVLNYSLESKKAEVAANAEVFSQNQLVSEAISSSNHATLISIIATSLESKKQSSIVVTDKVGQVLARAEDPDRWGDSISSDPLVAKALAGKSVSSFVVKEGTLAPVVYLQSAKPVYNGENLVGSVVVAVSLSNSFLDGVKSSTGLEAAVYAGNQRSATTIIAEDGKSRWTGIREENKDVASQVLKQGKTFEGSLSILNRSYLAVYQPLRNSDNEVVGMIFAGKPEVEILKDAERSIELTFVVVCILILVSTLPSWLVARFISKQLH